MLRWAKEIKFLESLGKPILIAWWGQKTKDDDDIDELASLDQVGFISPSQFLEMGEKSEPLPFWERVKRLVARERKDSKKESKKSASSSTDDTKREPKIYDRSYRFSVWNSAKNILDTSPTGSGKSHDAGLLSPSDLGVNTNNLHH